VVLSPSDDAYYHWVIVIGAAVFYNWTLLVVRWGTIIVNCNLIASSTARSYTTYISGTTTVIITVVLTVEKK